MIQMKVEPVHIAIKCFSTNMLWKITLRHNGMGRYNCGTCDKSFAWNTSLQYHVRKNHSEGTVFKCEKCDESYASFQSYKEHMDIHSCLSNTEKQVSQMW